MGEEQQDILNQITHFERKERRKKKKMNLEFSRSLPFCSWRQRFHRRFHCFSSSSSSSSSPSSTIVNTPLYLSFDMLLSLSQSWFGDKLSWEWIEEKEELFYSHLIDTCTSLIEQQQ